MKLRPAEILALLNLIAYGIIRLGADLHGFNWYGLEQAFGRLFYGFLPVILLLWAYVGYRLMRGKDHKVRVPWRDLVVLVVLFFSYWTLAGMAGGDRVDLIHMLSPIDRDDMLMGADMALLGSHPSQALEAFASKALTEFLLTIYLLAYLPLFIMLLFILHGRGYEKDRDVLVTAFTLAYTLAIPIFFLVPATGPAFNLDFQSDLYVPCGVRAQDMELAIKGIDSTQRNCFPSLHVALSTIALLMVGKLRRGEKAVFAALVLILWFSTLYLRYHYFIDLLAGWSLAIFSVWASKRLV